MWKEILVISLIGLFLWWQGRADENLHVVFCDVGQGDATLVSWRGAQMLVDTGPGGKVKDCLDENLPFGDRKIEVVVATHPDNDHVGGLDEVLEGYEVERLVINGVKGRNEASERVVELVEREEIEVRVAEAGERVVMGEVELEIWWPEVEQGTVLGWKGEDYGLEEEEKEMNKDSIVGLLSWGDFEVLLTGDIGQAEELALRRRGVLKEVEVLKVAHHGSKFSSSKEFLEKVRPKEAVMMVGKKNVYGHPAEEVLIRLEAVGSRVWRTDEMGEIEIVSDGERYWFE